MGQGHSQVGQGHSQVGQGHSQVGQVIVRWVRGIVR